MTSTQAGFAGANGNTRPPAFQPAFRLCLLIAYACWIETILKDWLVSSTDPYPYAGMMITGAGVVGGFLGLCWGRCPARWHRTLLLVVAAAALGGLIGRVAGLLSAAAAATCGLSAPWLFPGPRVVSGPWRAASRLLFVVGTALLCVSLRGRAWALPEGIAVAAVPLGVSVMIGPLVRGGPAVGWTWRAVLAGAGFILLFAASLGPWPRISDPKVFLFGDGFWSSPPHSSLSPAQAIVGQQGALAVVALAALLALAAAGAVGTLIGREGDEEFGHRLDLARGALSACAGLVAVNALTPSFLTVPAAGGTAVLAFCLAAAGVVSAGTAPARVRVARRAGTRGWVLAAGLPLLAGVAWMAHVEGVYRPRVEALAGVGVPPGYSQYTSLPHVSVAMQDATVAMEDRNFYAHHGFDWAAVHRALRVDVREQHIRQGGSTLTQQLAKNLFLSPARTFGRKLREAVVARELEQRLPKRRILELYLNTIDYGMGQHGITAAARYYFHKTPDRLTLADSAVLVGLVPRPPRDDITGQEDDLDAGRAVALARLAYEPQWLGHYSATDIERAGDIPLDKIMYPFKNAWDRGAVAEVPAVWHHVRFYFYQFPEDPLPIEHVSRSLLPPLAAFLEEARWQYGLVGVDHLGVYNDRLVRGSDRAVSSHAFGQAIDISGFRFADGHRLRVADHADPQVRARLDVMEAALRRHFDLVVDWRMDPTWHQTHFHSEVKGDRSAHVVDFEDR